MLPKMMLGFVVRRCAVALGHEPSPEEFAAWANHYTEDGRTYHLFGRPISPGEAKLILRHPARTVTAKSATVAEQPAQAAPPSARASNVRSFSAAVTRLKARAK